MSYLTMIYSFLQLKRHKRYSREKILKLQEKRFRKIIKYAFKNSKFYRDLYKSNGISEVDLSNISIDKLPTTNKQNLNNNFNDVLTVSDITKEEIVDFINENKNPNYLFKKKYHVINTSGTSGNQGIFVYSKKDWDSIYPYITETFSFNFKRKKVAYVGCLGGHFVVLSFVTWLIKGIPGIFCNLKTIDINKPIEDIIKELNDFQPDFLGGFFNQLKILAQYQKKGDLSIHPEIILNCSEPVIPNDKIFIENIFKTQLNNIYGFAECIISGVGKSNDPGIFLFDDKVLFEIKKDHILVTNLYNKTQPIIRYKVDDFLTLNKNLSNASPYTLIDSIIGRIESMIWFENVDGKLDSLHPFIFVDFFVKGLDKYQLVVKDKKSFDFLVVITDKDSNKVIDLIKKDLDKILRMKKFTNVTYSIKLVSDIPVDNKSGKYKLVVHK